MALQDPLAVYRRNQVMTLPPERLVLMLYNKALSCMAQSIAAIEKKDIEATNSLLCRAQEIITTLLTALDHRAGGEIAANLAGIYTYILNHLTKANIEKNAALIREAHGLLSKIRDGWMGAMAKCRKV